MNINYALLSYTFASFLVKDILYSAQKHESITWSVCSTIYTLYKLIKKIYIKKLPPNDLFMWAITLRGMYEPFLLLAK